MDGGDRATRGRFSVKEVIAGAFALIGATVAATWYVRADYIEHLKHQRDAYRESARLDLAMRVSCMRRDCSRTVAESYRRAARRPYDCTTPSALRQFLVLGVTLDERRDEAALRDDGQLLLARVLEPLADELIRDAAAGELVGNDGVGEDDVVAFHVVFGESDDAV